PRVPALALTNVLPLTGDTGPGLTMTREGAVDQKPTVWLRAVNGDYFRTMGIALRDGRSFRDEDEGRQPVAIVSELTAKRVWPGESAIGKRFRIGPETSQLFRIEFEVVGIAA